MVNDLHSLMPLVVYARLYYAHTVATSWNGCENGNYKRRDANGEARTEVEQELNGSRTATVAPLNDPIHGKFFFTHTVHEVSLKTHITSLKELDPEKM